MARQLTIIEIQAREDGGHGLQSQSGRKECWLDGWIAVPDRLADLAWECKGYCDLKISDGVLVDLIPGEVPEPEPEPELGPTQLDTIEAQVTYTAMMTDTLLGG